MERYYVGMHLPAQLHHFKDGYNVCVSWQVLKRRKSDINVGAWLMDSGAFTQLDRHSNYTEAPEVYAAAVNRWARCGEMHAAVTQDYMCEPFMLAKTGLSVADHQRLTIERYDAIRANVDPHIYVMPVLQGYDPAEYVAHIRQYGERLPLGAWVGVGSVCKRNGSINAIADVLMLIKRERPDLRLHGFGVKTTALRSDLIRDLLHTADSMAWSFAARKEGRRADANNWKEAVRFADKIKTMATRPHAYQWRIDL